MVPFSNRCYQRTDNGVVVCKRTGSSPFVMISGEFLLEMGHGDYDDSITVKGEQFFVLHQRLCSVVGYDGVVTVEDTRLGRAIRAYHKVIQYLAGKVWPIERAILQKRGCAGSDLLPWYSITRALLWLGTFREKAYDRHSKGNDIGQDRACGGIHR